MPLNRKQKLICWLVYGLIRIVYASYRYRRVNPELRETAKGLSKHGGLAYACWHQNTLSTVLAHAWDRLAVIVSRSFDGEIIAFVNKKFGVYSARGSSSRGGREALRELIHLAEDGYDIGFTVDGPRGPRHQVKVGVVTLASRTGSPILPIATRGRRSWTFLKSWDHFRLPKPFTEVLVVYGEPFLVPQELTDEDMAAALAKLTEALMELDRKLELMVTQGQHERVPAGV